MSTDGYLGAQDGYPRAQQWFANANGWRLSPQGYFSLAVLARNGVHGGRSGYRGDPLDHAEYYRKDRRAIAIVGHNYDGDAPDYTWCGTMGITRLAAEHGLIVHVAPAGKAASWWYPNDTMPLVITRPGVAVVWPTPEQIAATAKAHADYWAEDRERRQHSQAARQTP